jgi:hypothetical protein
MAQLFRRSANTVAQASIVGAILLVLGMGWMIATVSRSSYVTGAFETRTQPVPFSHKHHVGGLGVDCRYCHTSVEESAFASIPPTKTCMTCHSQIWLNAPMLEPVRASFRNNESLRWTKVHDLPDFVYFNHGIHINKGVGCVTCHGRVDQMPLMWQENSLQMEWCLQCHREPERYVRPREQVFSMDWKPPADQLSLGRRLVQEYKIHKLTDCSICHR